MLDDYVLGELLGVGFKTTVRVGVKDGKQWALKYMQIPQAESDKKLLTSLVTNEQRAMAIFDHPHILKLHSWSLTGTLTDALNVPSAAMYLVFELMNTCDLHDFVQHSGAFSEPVARYFIQRLLAAVDHMHERSYVHRDIKLMNVLLDDNYDPKLADFGTACHLSSDFKLLGKAGTPAYLPPEASSSVPYDGRNADMYALGVLLFAMVFGRPPFQSAKSQAYMAFCIQNEKFWARVCASKPLSNEIQVLLNNLLSPKPGTRPSIAEVKATPWYSGPTPTPTQIQAEFAVREALTKQIKSQLNQQKLAAEAAAVAGVKAPVAGFQPHVATPVL